jgi:hypothetical protein
LYNIYEEKFVIATVYLLWHHCFFLLRQIHQKIEQPELSIDDTAAKKMIQYKDSVLKTMESENSSHLTIVNNNNYKAIIELQQRNREKQKKAAYIRIGIGIFFLLLLVYSLVRRKKPKNV